MARFKHPLGNVQVAAPCKADWDQMIGSERMRFCAQCNLNVFNLSGMTRSEAESLIARNEQRLCVRFYRRYDGSIITRDCPVGLERIRRRVSYFFKAVAATTLTFLVACGFQSLFGLIPDLRTQRTLGVMVRAESGEPLFVDPSSNTAHPVLGKMERRPQQPKNKTKTAR